MSELFKPVAADGLWQHIAVVGGPFEDDHVLAIGFHQAAGILVDRWQTRGPNDLLFVPILYNYRHALELVLKEAIRQAAACLRANGVTDPDVAREAIDQYVTSTHAPGRLASKLEALLGDLELERLPADILEALHHLHELDPSGETFRYSKIKVGNGKAQTLTAARPDQEHVDVVDLANRFSAAFGLLSGGLLTELDEYRRWQVEMASEYGGEW